MGGARACVRRAGSASFSRGGARPIANFLIVADPDAERRETFLARAASSLAPVAGLATKRTDAGNTTMLWSASHRAPVSVDTTPRYAAVVLGDALLAGDAGRADARTIAASWTREDSPPGVYDGFHAAALLAEDGRVFVGADVLGLFPVYYAALGDVLLVGASPEPFRWHPAFRTAVSLEGLLTVLMLGGPFHGPCLLEHVRRLAIGRLLAWRPGGSPRELVQYDLPTEHRHATLSFDEQSDLLFHAYARAVRRHHPSNERQGVLLSGGRDSRLLAGCLEAQGSQVDALTLGLSTDHEVACAARVARALHFVHHVADVPYERFVEYATRSARWEHLAAGMATIHTWGAIEPSRLLPAHSANGYGRGREGPSLPPTFDGALRHLSRRALSPETLRSLVRGPEARDIVDGLVARLKASYDLCSDVPAEQGWRLYTLTYGRFYANGVPWRLSFGSWPVMVTLDREFLDAWVGIPIATLASREIVESMLRRRFPRLARLPLDRNAHSTRPIAPSLAYRAREWLSYRMPRGAARRDEVPRGERRQFYRQYDLDNPGWRAIRRAAEPHRARLAERFDLAAVNRVLSGRRESASTADAMTDGFEAKMLFGLMLWMHEHPGS